MILSYQIDIIKLVKSRSVLRPHQLSCLSSMYVISKFHDNNRVTLVGKSRKGVSEIDQLI